MDRLRAMEVFVRIVERGTLAGAADRLGVSAPSVVRTLAALERSLGVRLLNRTTRRSSLSDVGREYYERCRRVLAEIEATDAALRSRRTRPKGLLRLTAPVAFGQLRVAPIVTEFLGKHPGVEVELLLLDRVVDLVEEGVDAAIRIAHLPESSLVATPAGTTRRVVCASPAYLKRAGVPQTPADLAGHSCVVFTGLTSNNDWTFSGNPSQVSVRPRLRTNQFNVAIDAIVNGLGCGQFLSYQVEALFAARKATHILEAFEPPAVPIQIVYAHARFLSPNVRAFVDFAVPRLRRSAA
jgi:DNA-binding transcriptional LysR family regulator